MARVKDPVADGGGAWFTPPVPSAAHEGTRPRIPASARTLRYLLLGLLALATVLTVAWLPPLRAGVASGRWPRAILAIPPGLLAVFICGYAVYRFTLVRAGRYPPGKALAQVGLMVLALLLVAGIALEPVPLAPQRGRLERGLRSGSPDVRALAAELARYRAADRVRPLVPVLVELLDDPDAEVRREAHTSLVAITGEDLGEGEGATARWRARFGEPAAAR